MRARVLTSRPIRALLLPALAAATSWTLVLSGTTGARAVGTELARTELLSIADEWPAAVPTVPIGPSGEPSISADGRYVAFSSTAALDPLDASRDGASDLDVYVRDRWTHHTTWLSHRPGFGPSQHPSISADGRYVAFQTTTSPGPSAVDRRRDIVVADRDPDGDGVVDERGCPPRPYCHEFTQVSPGRVDALGRAITGASAPSISADGTAVVWVASQAGPASPDWLRRVVYRSTLTHGRSGAVTGVRAARVDALPAGLSVRDGTAPALAADGRRLVLAARVQDATAGARAAGTAVLGVDLAAGPIPGSAGERYRAVRLDVDSAGHPLHIPVGFDPEPAINGNGRQVAFTAPGSDSPVVLAVRWDGHPPRSELVSSDVHGTPVNGGDPALSADGRFIAFSSWSRTVHNGVDGPSRDCDPVAGPSDTGGSSRLLSLPAFPAFPGLPALPGLPLLPPIVAGPGDGNPLPLRLVPPVAPQPSDSSHCDIVLRDLGTDRARAAAGLPRLPGALVSPSLARDCVPRPAPDTDCEGDEASRTPALSADGSVVAYESQSATLVPHDPNGTVQDVFARRVPHRPR